VLVAVAAGFVCEQLVYRSSRNAMAETGLQKLSPDLQAAIAHAAFMPRLFGFAIAIFAAVVIGFGMLLRALTQVPSTPRELVPWRRIVSTALYFVAANLIVPNLATLGVAATSIHYEGAKAGTLTAAAVVLIGSALGWFGTSLRDAAGATTPVVLASSLGGGDESA
jgi:hypothetical protein